MKTTAIVATAILTAMLLLASPASAGPVEDVINEVSKEDCPFIQVYTYDPYVGIFWACLELPPGEA